MNRRQGLSKSNLVLRIRLAQFCGVEPHVISDPEFHTEECSCPGMLGERRTVTLWETETFLSSILIQNPACCFTDTHVKCHTSGRQYEEHQMTVLTLHIDESRGKP